MEFIGPWLNTRRGVTRGTAHFAGTIGWRGRFEVNQLVIDLYDSPDQVRGYSNRDEAFLKVIQTQRRSFLSFMVAPPWGFTMFGLRAVHLVSRRLIRPLFAIIVSGVSPGPDTALSNAYPYSAIHLHPASFSFSMTCSTSMD